MRAIITDIAIRQLKKCLAVELPDIKSAHRAEALAIGLGYRTKRSLDAALKKDPRILATVAPEAFTGFLHERGYQENSTGGFGSGFLEAVFSSLCLKDYHHMVSILASSEWADLTPNGFDDGSDESLRFDSDCKRQVFLCLEYLAAHREFSSGNTIDSYRLKHDIERWLKADGRPSYIENGSAILAALLYFCRVERLPDGLTARITLPEANSSKGLLISRTDRTNYFKFLESALTPSLTQYGTTKVKITPEIASSLERISQIEFPAGSFRRKEE